MATVRPFRGVRYAPDRFERMDVVISQPYDRISPELEREYASLSPYNITGITLDRDEGGSSYSRARRNYDQWLAKGILIREDQPAFYAYEQTFTIDGRTFTRLGLIAALELAEFEEGIVLPHERTFSGPKQDRLRLMNALSVNPEQVFLLYPDPENRVNALVRRAIAGRKPDIDAVERLENQVRQRVWVITQPETIAEIQAVMAPMRGLIIADGHHRYETALTYRRQQRALHPDLPATAALNHTGVMLVSMDDPGLVVLPTHREIRHFTAIPPREVLARAAAYFAVQPAADLAECLAAVNAGAGGHTFGFYGGPEVGFHTLALRDEALIDRLIPGDRSRAWKDLAVSVLHRILLEQVVGLPTEGVEEKSLIHYYRDPQEPVTNVDEGRSAFVFFLSPTTMAQIKAVAGRGEKMPQKSTDFYPKVISGLVMFPVGATERLGEESALA